MNKRQAKPLIPLLGGRWARVGLTALLTAFVAVGAQAQTAGEGGTQPATGPQQRPAHPHMEHLCRGWTVVGYRRMVSEP